MSARRAPSPPPVPSPQLLRRPRSSLFGGLRHHLLRRLHHPGLPPWGRWLNDLQSRLVGGPRRIELTVRSSRFPSLLPPLRAAFVADLHAGPTTSTRALQDAAAALVTASADLLLLGGDYVFADAAQVRRLLPLLERAVPRARLGAFAVLGNHDLAEGRAQVERALRDVGVRLLVNDSVALPPPYEWLRVVGLDDLFRGAPDADAAFAAVSPARDVTLLLTHNPDGAALLGMRRVDLILAGHTHGGGVGLPGGWPLLRPSRLGYHAGCHDTPWGPLVVSRGIGCVELPLRPFVPADVVVVTFRAADGGSDDAGGAGPRLSRRWSGG